jgi:hypothetical protein
MNYSSWFMSGFEVFKSFIVHMYIMYVDVVVTVELWISHLIMALLNVKL